MGDDFFALFRWYRCAQPPATVWQPFGLQPPLAVGALCRTAGFPACDWCLDFLFRCTGLVRSSLGGTRAKGPTHTSPGQGPGNARATPQVKGPDKQPQAPTARP